MDLRNWMAAQCGKHVEFMVMMYSTTTEGYQDRISRRLKAIQNLPYQTASPDEQLVENAAIPSKANNTPPSRTGFDSNPNNECSQEIFRIFRKVALGWKSCARKEHTISTATAQ